MHTSQQLTDRDLLGLNENYNGSDFENYASESKKVALVGSNLVDFKIKIVNGTTGAVNIALSRAIFDVLGIDTVLTVDFTGETASAVSTPHFHNVAKMVAANIDADCVLDDGTVLTTDNKTVVCTGIRQNIRNFLNFTQKNAVRIQQIIIDVDDKAAFEQDLTVLRTSPFRKLGEDARFSLTDYVNPSYLNDKKIIIDLVQENYNLQLDDQTVLLLGVGAGRTYNITYKIDMINNEAAKFNTAMNA